MSAATIAHRPGAPVVVPWRGADRPGTVVRVSTQHAITVVLVKVAGERRRVLMSEQPGVVAFLPRQVVEVRR